MKLVYKHYSNNEFIGELNVVNDVTISEEINSIGTEINIEVGVNLEETATGQDPIYIVDENNDFLITEDGDELITGTELVVDGIPNVGDIIKIYQYDDYNLNGVLIFTGKVNRWKGVYGTATTMLFVKSRGSDLDQYLVSVPAGEVIAEEQDTVTSIQSVFGTTKTPVYDRTIAVFQTFTVGTTTEIDKVYLNIGRSFPSGVSTARIEIIEGTPVSPGTSLVAQEVIISEDTPGLFPFSFTQAITLVQSTNYFIKITNPLGGNLSETNTLLVGYNFSGTYPDGAMYIENEISGLLISAYDIFFRLVSTGGGIGNQFNSEDPSSILTEVIDNYNAAGGIITYSDTSIATTNSVVSYTFKFNKVFDAIKKIVELAPVNWYFYVDASDETIYFDTISETPDHYLTMGVNVADVDIEYTLDGLKNLVYVIGAEQESGSNLVVSSSENESIENYGQALEIISDTRVTQESTANILINNTLKQNREPKFRVVVEITATTYDIASFRVGQVIRFRNAKGFLNDLQLQIVGKVYMFTSVRLYLATLPPAQNKRIEDIRRNLTDLQTKDNPSD